MLPVDVDGVHHPTEIVLAQSGVVAESLDVEKTSVGIEANLPQSRGKRPMKAVLAGTSESG